jgi:hypothetical protein
MLHFLGGAHGVALDSKVGPSAPPLFGLRHFPVELVGLRGVFVARLRRGNFSCALPVAFFSHPNQAAVKNGHQRAPFWGCRPKPRWGFAPNSLVCANLFRALPTVHRSPLAFLVRLFTVFSNGVRRRPVRLDLLRGPS